MAETALIVIDMINTYAHHDAHRLLPSARAALPAITRLIEGARGQGETALDGPYADLVRPIAPDESSLFVVKARHSIFYETPRCA